METLRMFLGFYSGSLRLVSKGNRYYWAWITLLVVLIVSGDSPTGTRYHTG